MLVQNSEGEAYN